MAFGGGIRVLWTLFLVFFLIQLKDANEKWVAEWDKLQEHFETRTVDLRAEVDRLNKALTESKIKEQSKEADFEQHLMGLKQKIAEQEVGFFYSAKTFFSFQNNSKNLDPSYKMDLALWDYFHRENPILKIN